MPLVLPVLSLLYRIVKRGKNSLQSLQQASLLIVKVDLLFCVTRIRDALYESPQPTPTLTRTSSDEPGRHMPLVFVVLLRLDNKRFHDLKQQH